MTEEMSTVRTQTPWHLWLVGILALLWNAVGAFDYLMTQTQNAGYMSQFTPEQLEFFYGLPTWVVASWALAVWGGVLGTILLLLRKKLAVGVFLVSFLCMMITSIHNYLLSNGLEVMGDPFSMVFSALIFVFALCLFLYARAMAQRGVLT